jgi:hypothetical protein
MAMQCIRPSNEVCGFQVNQTQIDILTPQTAIASPDVCAIESNSNLLLVKPLKVCLNLENFKSFAVVDRQFQHYGVTLKNAIALVPSNPAYPPRTGSTVLMGAPKSGWLEVIFSQPISKFCCYITSSQRTILSAYDHQDKLLGRQFLEQANLAGFDSLLPANAPLMLESPNIARITLYAFDGQLTLADLSFES